MKKIGELFYKRRRSIYDRIKERALEAGPVLFWRRAFRSTTMQRTQRIIGYLAVWLVLAFSMSAACIRPAIAACETQGHSSVPRACCAVPSQPMCCHAMHRASAHHSAASGHCRLGDCTCQLSAGQNTASLPVTTTELSFPALLVPRSAIFITATPRCIAPLAATYLRLYSTVRCASSPRAPPFQG